jgi:O-antigen ligase
MIKTSDINYKKYINYLFIAYALSFPISKAATNLFEVLILLLWIVEGNWKEKFSLYKTNLLSITIALLIAYSLLSILWHGNIMFSLHYVAKYRHLLIIFAFYNSLQREYIKPILSAFFFGMLISEVVSYGIFFELIHYKNILPSDPTPFMSHMTYSTVLAFTVNILLVRYFYEKHLHYKLFYTVFFLTATANLFINGGKTGQIIFIVLILVTVFSSLKHKVKAFGVSVTLLVLTFFLAFNLSPNFHERSNQLYSEINNMIQHNDYRNSSSGARVALTTIGINTFLDHPILGTGLAYSMEDAKTYADKHDFNIEDIERFADYHNGYLTISVQLGIVGLLISLFMIYGLFTLKFRNKEYKVMSFLFAISFVMFSFTHNTFHTMNPMIFFALFTGLFNAISKLETKH